MIDRVTIQNYKSLKDVTVTFDSRLTVLVGTNGSGKSSVLKCIHALCDMAGSEDAFQNRVASATKEIADTISLGTATIQMMEIIVGVSDDHSGFRFKMIPNSVTKPNTSNWECAQIIGGVTRKRTTHTSEFGQVSWPFVPAEFVRFHAASIAVPTVTTVTPPPMKPDGTGVASVMAYFKLYDETRYDQVEEAFRRVVPQIQKVRISRVPTSTGGTYGEGLIFDLPNRKGVPASQMSDGTLYALGLIVKILDPQRPKTLLIDDIDHGFHPKAQTQLVELIKKLLDEFPDLQIIATSHSPYILSGLAWDEVRVLHLRDDGTTLAKSLKEHPKYEKWHGTMSPGEFWSHAGEEWVSESPGMARA